MRALLLLVFGLALVASVAALGPPASRPAPAAAQASPRTPRSFTGVVTDSECDDGYHGAMRMGDTDAECVVACVDAHAARYVLHSSAGGGSTYGMSDQKAAAAFAARRAVVTGRLDASTNTIVVESIAPAP